MPEAPLEPLAREVYAALAAGDEAALRARITEDFAGVVAEGFPYGIGGPKAGADAMIEDGWWAIGRRYAVRAEPEEFVACTDGRLLVTGRYRGTARGSGAEVDAAFTHIWTARDGRLAGVRQLTDTARWPA